MTSDVHPAVARRRLRIALRRAREEAGLTQAHVAEEMEWSVSKVMRIESGEVTVSINDARLLLPLLRITDDAAVADLLQAARDSKRKQWWDEPRFRENMTPAMRQLIQFEAEARVIRYFYPSVVPGPLQVPAYAEALLRPYSEELTDEVVAVRLEARMRRRRALLEHPDPPTILLLLDESVLLRQLGNPALLAQQLVNLHDLATAGRIIVRVLPFSTGGPQLLLAAFEIFYLTDRGIDGDGDAVMYRESQGSDEILEDEIVIRRHLMTFESAWHGALPEDLSTEMLGNAAKAASAEAKTQ